MSPWDPYCEKGQQGCLDQNCGCVNSPLYRKRNAQARGLGFWRTLWHIIRTINL